MKNIFILLFIALPLSIFAQSNYYPGYVLKNNGDTLKGYINYHEWSQSPHSIDFKVNKNDKNELHFDPQVIKGFHINGLETYTSFTGFISNGRVDLSSLHNGIDTGKTADTLFLKQIVSGRNLTLFYQGDNIKTRFFIAETNGEPVELNYYVYLNDLKEVTKSSIYKGQLMLYANKFQPGHDKLTGKIEQIDYDAGDLQNIVNEINDNKATAKKGPKGRFFVGIGINSTTTETGQSQLYAGKQTSSFTSPKINAGIDIFGNPTVQQLIFRAELSFSYIDAQFKSVYINSLSSINSFSFSQYTTAITPQILFNVFNKNSVKVFIDAGIGLNFSAYPNSIVIVAGAPYKLSTFWVNYPLQAGIVFNKKIELCFTYAGYGGYSPYDTFYVENQSTSLGVKYLFGK